MRGVDTANRVTAAAAATFAQDRNDFVIRYLDAQESWKSLKVGEPAIIRAAGLNLSTVFEKESNFISGGGSAADQWAGPLAEYAATVGQPKQTVIYHAGDFDAQSSDLLNCAHYMEEMQKKLPDYEHGIYGSRALGEYLVKNGIVTHFWQTYAWSGGLLSPLADLFQFKNGETLGGLSVDLCRSWGNEGFWWPSSCAVKLPVTDANELIELLQGEWKFSAGQPTRDKIHAICNNLRIASGQSVQEG